MEGNKMANTLEGIKEDLQKIENTLKAGIPYDNAYFMSVYTTCMDIIKDRCQDEVTKHWLLRPAVKMLEFASKGGIFKTEAMAISLLLNVPNLVADERLKSLATSKNTTLKALEFKHASGASYTHPIQYANYLCKVAKEGMEDLFLAEMCMLECEAEDELEVVTDTSADMQTTCYSHMGAISLAYIDTLLDISNLHLSSIGYEARNNFSIAVVKLSKAWSL